MIKQLRKVGNSTALLDKPILELLGIKDRDKVQLMVTNGSLVITPVQPATPSEEKFDECVDRVMKRQAQAFEAVVAMTGEPVFLTVEQVLEIHRRGIEQHGGSVELRDRGLLESAVAMPAAQFGGQYLHDGLAAMVAAYLFHLCKNHPFVDGNKRVSVTVAEVFVELNGWRLVATDNQLESLTVGVADSSISKQDATTFFKSRVKQ